MPAALSDEAMVDLQRKAGLLLENALMPVVTQVGKELGRQALIAFLTTLIQQLALQSREAFGTPIAMNMLKGAVANVISATEEQAEAEMMGAAAELLRVEGEKGGVH